MSYKTSFKSTFTDNIYRVIDKKAPPLVFSRKNKTAFDQNLDVTPGSESEILLTDEISLSD